MLRVVQCVDSPRTLVSLMGAYALLMMHFVFSRAFRDSLLGSHLSVGTLPALTFAATAVSVVISLLLSRLLSQRWRLRIIQSAYVLNAALELGMGMMALFGRAVYLLYYVEVSVSTAIGLSMIWILIGDWANLCHVNKAEAIPAILICGTAAGMFAGFGLTHLRSATSFPQAATLLACMNLGASAFLLLYDEGRCRGGGGTKEDKALSRSVIQAKGLVLGLAAVTVIGAATSTLLDLLFRVQVSEHFHDQPARLQFLGVFQGLLSIGALALQFVLARSVFPGFRRRLVTAYPGLLCAGGIAVSLSPVFGNMAALRVGEYSLRNSFFRYGSEMTYGVMPDGTRARMRPLIDVIGERAGDVLAAGLLALLLLAKVHAGDSLSLVILSLCSAVLWWACRSLLSKVERVMHAGDTADGSPAPEALLHDIAHERPIVI